MKPVTVTPRCQYAGAHRIRCDQPGCDYCRSKRLLVAHLSTLTEEQLADYCRPRFDQLAAALLDAL